jgi:hypothetical protein
MIGFYAEPDCAIDHGAEDIPLGFGFPNSGRHDTCQRRR